jgi:predicted CopG family antitoxin
VSDKTLQILNKLKDETGLKSHDEVIRELIAERRKLPKSMFGSNPKLRPFSARDEAESHEL